MVAAIVFKSGSHSQFSGGYKTIFVKIGSSLEEIVRRKIYLLEDVIVDI